MSIPHPPQAHSLVGFDRSCPRPGVSCGTGSERAAAFIREQRELPGTGKSRSKADGKGAVEGCCHGLSQSTPAMLSINHIPPGFSLFLLFLGQGQRCQLVAAHLWTSSRRSGSPRCRCARRRACPCGGEGRLQQPQPRSRMQVAARGGLRGRTTGGKPQMTGWPAPEQHW